MLTLSVKIKDEKVKAKTLREKGELPAVLYGSKIKNLFLQADEKEFEKIYKQAGESSMIKLNLEDKEFLVLIKDIQTDPVTDKFIHIDFYQPLLTKKTEAKIPLEFEGESLAVKDLGGTLIKNIQEIEVKALPQNLPPVIKVKIDCLKTFEDNILVKDLEIKQDIDVLKNPDEIVASVAPPTKVEEELEKPIEENVEEIEKIEKPEKTEDETTEINS